MQDTHRRRSAWKSLPGWNPAGWGCHLDTWGMCRRPLGPERMSPNWSRWSRCPLPAPVNQTNKDNVVRQLQNFGSISIPNTIAVSVRDVILNACKNWLLSDLIDGARLRTFWNCVQAKVFDNCFFYDAIIQSASCFYDKTTNRDFHDFARAEKGPKTASIANRKTNNSTN